jgi:hypothetical protein
LWPWLPPAIAAGAPNVSALKAAVAASPDIHALAMIECPSDRRSTLTHRGADVNRRMDRETASAYASHMTNDHPDGRKTARQSGGKDLDALNRPETVFGSATMARAARRAGDHFAGADAHQDSPDDPIELWGRRIGRALSAIAFVVLAIYLYLTYVRS